MNLKANKDIIIRVVKNFAGVITVGAMILLIAMMFFAESIIFSKEVLGLLIGIAILFTGVGGIVSATLIFFSCCMKKIAKLEKAVADRDNIIANQNNQLLQVRTYVKNHNVPTSQKNSAKDADNKIFKEIESLSAEIPLDESPELEAQIGSDSEPIPSQDSPVTEDAYFAP